MNPKIFFRLGAISLLLIVPLGIYLAPSVVAAIVQTILFLSPLWLPVLLVFIAWPLWLLYIRSSYVASVPYTTFELIPGENTPKTARAMELVLYSLYRRIHISRVSEALTGQQSLPWSFELAAHAGTVRFFMRVPTRERQMFEVRVRSEYTDIDMNEVRDYARELDFNPITSRLTMHEFEFEKPDPYPLQTYEVYEKIKPGSGPFNSLLEKLVTFGEDEHLFVSYIIRPHQRSRKHFFDNETDTLHHDAHAEIAKLVGGGGDPRKLSIEKQKLVNAIEEGLKRPSYECGVRIVYTVSREKYSEEREEEVKKLYENYASAPLNALVPYDPQRYIAWPLSDMFVALPWIRSVYLLNLFRRRAFFTPPYYGKICIVNTAELATLFHLPHITRASALARARGNRLEPPDNLPIAI